MYQSSIYFDGYKVTINYDRDEVEPLIDFLFGDLESDSIESIQARFTIRFNQSSDTWELSRNDEKIYSSKELNGLGNYLGGEALFSLIENNTAGMAVHAGLVSKSNTTVLLPADSGSGKSSVTTWLLTNGWHYHTDELVTINLQSGELNAFTRPLNIKSHGLAAIGEIFDFAKYQQQVRKSNMVSMIPHRLVNPNYQKAIPPLTTIVFPHYSKDAEPAFQKLSGAEAGLELMRSNVIARNLPGHGFSDVIRLVKELPAYRLHYQHFDNLSGLFEQLGVN